MAMPTTAAPAKTTAPTIPLSKVAAELAEKTGMTKKDAATFEIGRAHV